MSGRDEMYLNTGAGWDRPDGTRISAGQIFVPTREELIRKAHKLEPVRRRISFSRTGEMGGTEDVLPEAKTVTVNEDDKPRKMAWSFPDTDEDEEDGEED